MLELVGVDTGGTFTDFILYKNGSFVSYKIPSTPDAPEQAILQGLKHLNVQFTQSHIVHGTTVATNALLEGKGAKTAFITNQGLKHLLHIGRQARAQLYSLCPPQARQLINQSECFEINARVDAHGQRLTAVTTKQLQSLKKQLQAQGFEAVAICMLFSFLNSEDEQSLETLLESDFFVSRSSKILPEQREYERAVVTWLNSYLGPKTQSYLINLQRQLDCPIHVMQSDATTMPANRASQQAVRLLLSGPAGGVMAASVIAKATQCEKLLTFDMGGTSTDVSLLNKQAKFTNDARIADLPLAISLLDIHTIGAGGGSIARVDQAGGLHVGPESAAAMPGPACYGHGGRQATITDANVVLGRLPVSHPWKSGVKLDKHAAQQAVNVIAQSLGCSLIEAAHGILEIANAHMVQALRVISIHRGYDPSQFSLFPFGGAGGLHMCAVAKQLGVTQILVPRNAGILSAQGMIFAPAGQTTSRSVCRSWSDEINHQISALFSQLANDAESQLQQAGIQAERTERWLELRYQGQSSTICIAWDHEQTGEEIANKFTHAHQHRYGFSLPEHDVELVTIRVWVYQDVQTPEFERLSNTQPASAIDYCQIDGEINQVPIFQRQQLACHQQLVGPSVILDDSGTLYVEPGWQGEVNEYGHIRLQMVTDCQQSATRLAADPKADV